MQVTEIFRAREAFSYNDEHGVPKVVTPGSLISSDDPGYKGREHLFEPLEIRMNTEKAVRSGKRVEDASAEPNEKRSVSTTPKQSPAEQKSGGGLKTSDFPSKSKGDAK